MKSVKPHNQGFVWLKTAHRLRAVFHGMRHGIALCRMITDADGKPCDYRFVEANPAFEEITGRNRDELLRGRGRDLFIDFNPTLFDVLVSVTATGEPAHVTSHCPVMSRQVELYAFSPQPGYIAVSLTDATDRKRLYVEEKSKGKLEKEAILNGLKDISVVFIDTELRIRWANSSAYEEFGSADGDLTGGRCHEILRGRVEPCPDCAVTEALRTGMVNDREYATDDGRTFVVRCSPYRDTEGRILGVIHSLTNITAVKRSEAALGESEERFRLLLENAPDAVFVQTGGRFAYLNSAALRLFGAEIREELLGRPVSERLHPRILDTGGERTGLLAANGKPASLVEQIYLRLDGSPVPVEISAVPVHYPGESGTLVFARDITERKRAEDMMIRSEWLLSSIQDAQNLYIAGGDQDRVFRTLLETLVEITGSEYGFLQEVSGTAESGVCTRMLALSDISWDEDSRRLFDTLTARGGEFRDLDNLIGAPVLSGTLVIANDAPHDPRSGGLPPGHPPIRTFLGIPMFFGKELIGVAGIANREGGYSEEIARFLKPFIFASAAVIHAFRKDREQELAIRALRESEDRFSLLAGNIHEVFWIASSDWSTVSYVSPAYERVWGSSRSSLYENPISWLDAVMETDREPLLEAMCSTINSKRDQITLPDYRITRPDGTLRWIRSHAYPIRDGQMEIVLFVGIHEDITERKVVEEERAALMEQLHHARRMEAIGQLAGGIAHDFNNLITAILGCGQLLRDRLPPDSDLLQYMDIVLSSADRAAGLTRSLLAFSRKQAMESRPVDLNEIIERITRLISRLIGEDIDLRTELCDGRLVVNGDIVQIEQVLMNLATNARDAMPGGGTILIRTEALTLDTEFVNIYGQGEPGAYAVIHFSDTGEGITEEIRTRVFEPFFTTKEPGKGTGLGLSIVHGIIRQHGGYINLESTPGHGTAFTVYLPLIPDLEMSEGTEVRGLPGGGTETILVAEDDPAVRILIRMVLEEEGYRVLEAVDGQDAIDLFAEHGHEIDLALLDVVMPRKNGSLALQEIRRMRGGIKALFISGYPADFIDGKGVLQQGVHFISKPLTPLALLKKVRETLG